jgi:hypothetical protein
MKQAVAIWNSVKLSILFHRVLIFLIELIFKICDSVISALANANYKYATVNHKYQFVEKSSAACTNTIEGL